MEMNEQLMFWLGFLILLMVMKWKFIVPENGKSMATQVAAKGADGKVYLHSVYIASDRKSDGNWGPLYGHIMWSDWMAEKNVDQEPPSRQ